MSVKAETRRRSVLTEDDEQTLASECGRYGKYLSGEDVTPYQALKYVEFHRQRSLSSQNTFDAFLLRFSGHGPIGLGLADAYSGLFCRTCLLRKKLMLTLAILECSPPSYVGLDAPDPGGRRGVIAGMLGRLAIDAAVLSAAAILLLPVQIVLVVLPKAKA